MVRDCAPDEIGVSVSYPLPGTRFYDRVRSELGTKQNWVDSQDLDMMFAGTYHPDFYRVLHKVVHKKFSVWRGMQTMKNALRNPYHIPRKSIRHVASMLYHGATLPIELGRLAMFENRTRGVPG
jgi:anaerobic magnesium-protoporphyrin IX monomethyl ester cyclase